MQRISRQRLTLAKGRRVTAAAGTTIRARLGEEIIGGG